MSLEDSAQIAALEFDAANLSLHKAIAEHVSSIRPAGDNTAITDFIADKSFDVITTNYDKLFEALAGADRAHSIAPGLPIPRYHSPIRVHHIHGSVDSPPHMVVTSDDYFRFLNADSYFSRKLNTLLHENTVVILGYSLSDTNLRTILSDYKAFSRSIVIGSHMFFVSRSRVAQHIKDYYAHSFGIRVLDQLEVHDFFNRVGRSMESASKCAAPSRTNIDKVLNKNFSYADGYLKLELSFFEIISSISAVGISINSQKVVSLIGNIIQKKNELTQVHNAWDQYEQLATWLLYLGSILEIRGTSIEATFLAAVLRSMTTMRSQRYIGYSWHAYRIWMSEWPSVMHSNRVIIRNHIRTNTTWEDALVVVQST